MGSMRRLALAVLLAAIFAATGGGDDDKTAETAFGSDPQPAVLTADAGAFG